MNQGFYTGISGMLTHQMGMDTVSNNISNVNTIGYKSNNAEFKTIFDNAVIQTVSPTANSVGIGSTLSATSLDLSQGNLLSSDNTFDLALSGEGWFGIQNGTETYYTRNGVFGKDAQGYLVNSEGQYLLGTIGNNITPGSLTDAQVAEFGNYYPLPNSANPPQPYAIDAVNSIALGATTAQGPIMLPDYLYYPPRGTQSVDFQSNLDPEVIIDLTNIPLDGADYTTTVDTAAQTLSMSGGIGNTQGIQNPVPGDTILVGITDANGTEIFTSVALQNDLTWSLTDYDISNLAFASASDLTVAPVLRTNQEIPNEEQFNVGIFSPDGEQEILHMEFTKQVPQATTGTQWDATFQIWRFVENYDGDNTYDPARYVINNDRVYEIIDEQSGQFSFNTEGAMISETMPTMSNNGQAMEINYGSGFTGLVSMSQGSVSTVSMQDGYALGYLKDYGIDGNNQVVANFTNGRTSAIAKLAVYHFQNDQGLEKLDHTHFQATENSGNPIFYTDANGNVIETTRIMNHMLETSNVDLTSAMTELIIMQRAYSANAKSITTSDELIQKALQM